ncbi:MAG: hypothetical protein ABDH91_07820 [Bacteroidia bacterium]
MPDSVSFPKPELPPYRKPGEGGVWLQDFLSRAAQELSDDKKPLFIQHAFRWFVQLHSEGDQRPSEEELRLHKESFYYLLPAELRPFFPWAPPEPLPPLTPQKPPYPVEENVPRQYGFLAAQWLTLLAQQPPAVQEAAGKRLGRHLAHTLRQQGQNLEEAALLQALRELSGGRLQLPATLSVGSSEERAQPPATFRRRKRFFPRRPFRK